MYWCEGDRSQESRTYRVALTSADPKILVLYVDWLERYYCIKRTDMKVRLHLWPTSDEVVAKSFWSEQLKINQDRFTKSWTKPRGQGTAKRMHANGICRVSISSKEALQQIIADIKKEFEG